VCKGCDYIVEPFIGTKKSPDLSLHQKSCEKYKSFRSSVNSKNGKWMTNKSEEEIEIWRKNVGKAVSIGILASEHAIEVRKQSMIKCNKSDAGRIKSSETAKITSARPDIQKARAEVLRLWRKNNPDWMDKTVHRFSSKPEKELYRIVKEFIPLSKSNQRIRNNKFLTESRYRQCDILDRESKIVIEFDGPFHFHDIGKSKFEFAKQKDTRFNEVMLSKGYIVIRISYDLFSYSKVAYGFKEETISSIRRIISEKTPGIFLLGGMYSV